MDNSDSGVLTVWLAAGCAASRDIDDVRGRHHRHGRGDLQLPVSGDEPWHLQIDLQIDAAPHRVADVLETEGMVVVRDRDPMIVQQLPGNPRDGWNGSLTASGAGSALGLVYNNAMPSTSSAALDWAKTCTGFPD